MPMNTDPVFPLTPNVSIISFATANTNRDGTGTIATLFTPGALGSRIERAYVQAAGTVTAGVIRLFLSQDAGSTNFLLAEILVPATVPSVAVAAWSKELEILHGRVLPLGTLVRISTHNAETFKALIFGGNF